jgi:hypothetical protein
VCSKAVRSVNCLSIVQTGRQRDSNHHTAVNEEHYVFIPRSSRKKLKQSYCVFIIK